MPSETDRTREYFRTRLLERDIHCVWTGIGSEYGAGMHVIPFKRGTDVCLTFFFAGMIICPPTSVVSPHRTKSAKIYGECDGSRRHQPYPQWRVCNHSDTYRIQSAPHSNPQGSSCLFNPCFYCLTCLPCRRYLDSKLDSQD